ncbi:MAG: hypothetical protein G5700_07545 [Serratia symbiotica]|nr:hypothetical protein [Serratia symbiotica]
MKQEWRNDVQVLRTWVENAEKIAPAQARVREYCANTREIINLRMGVQCYAQAG